METSHTAKMLAYWVAQASIVRTQTQIDRERNPRERQHLEELLVEQRRLIAPD